MQSKSTLDRILAMLLCLALLLSCLPGISIGAKAEEAVTEDVTAAVSTATDETEAESDLLSASLGHNTAHWENYAGTDTGLTAEKSSESVNGTESTKAWAFKATAAANMSGATAQIHLTENTDFSSHYLMMDVKYVTTGSEESASFTARLHDPSWGNLNNAQSVTVTPGQWQTVSLIPSEAGMMEGKDVSELAECKLITFSFDFASTTGAERAIYIDNVRAVKIESAKEDWIKLPIDSGMSSELTYEVVTGLSVGAGSTQSLKLYTTKKPGSICFHTQEGVNQGKLDAYPDMTSGILGGWFWFGESTPSGNVTLTYSDWGTSNSVDITFVSKGNGWYYGTVDCAGFTTTSGSTDNMDEAWRVDIANLPKKSTMYIDCLTHTQTAIDGLSITYPFNTQTVQQTGSADSGFNALTFISAINEVESAQLIMTPSFDVTSFELTMHDMVNDNGNVIAADAFEVYVQHYVTAEGSKNGGAQVTDEATGVTVWNAEDHLTAGVDGVFPNALIPQSASIKAGENVIAAGNNQGIWINLNVGKDTAPGTYTGFASLNVDGTVMQVPVTIIIRDVTLPDEVHVKSSFQIWWDMLEAGEGTISSSLARTYEDYLISKRIMPMDAWNITRYDNEFVNAAVEWAQDPAISSYALKYGKTDDGGLDTDALTTTLTTLINKNIELAAAGSDTDLFAKAYLYFGQICDEPRSDEGYAKVNECTAALETVKEALTPLLADYPELQASFMDLKHLVTGPDPADKTYAFLDAQDYGSTALTGDSYVYVPQYQWLNTEEQRALYADEEEIWWYGCNHPVNPYPSYSFNSPLITSRAIGWMMYDYDIDGLLYWCVNSWVSYGEDDADGDGIDDNNGQTANGFIEKDIWGTYTSSTPGEGILVLPGSDYGITGPIGTIRLESIREGNEDYEYLWLLENLTGSDSEIATYTAGMYDGVIPSTDVTVHHANRINLLNRLETLSIEENGATVKEADLPDMPVDPQPTLDPVDYPVDIIAVGTNANAVEQTEVTNGTDTAWKITYTSTGTWKYPEIVMDKEYDISKHMLIMDVKVTGMETCRMNLSTIDGDWSAASASTYLTDMAGWNTMTFDLSANGAGLTEMTKFSLGFNVPSSTTDYAIYIDNIYLVPLETVADDWIHMYQDTGDFYKNTTTSFVANMLKAQNSGMSMKVVAPADAAGKFTFNTEYAVTLGQLTAKPDFSSGTLGAWFYFGDQDPSAYINITTSSWKASADKAFSFVYGGNGWYYGTVDTSTITLPEGGSLEGIIRLTFGIPAGYTVYIDGITFPNVEEVTAVYREDLSADWTNLPATGAELTEDVCYAEGSSQSLMVTNSDGYVTIDVSKHLPDMTEGTLGAWFYFGDAEPSATLDVVDDEGYESSMSVDGPVAFAFGEGVDGWYYGTVDVSTITFDEFDAEDGASADAVTAMNITVSADSTVYIDCLSFEAPEEEPTTEAPATEPVVSDPGDLLANASAADTVGILGGGNFSYDANSTVTYGEASTKSWMFAGNESAAGWPTALLNLGQSYDMSGKTLAFDIKTEGARGYVGVSQLYNSSWASLCAADQANYTTTFTADEWTTVRFDLDTKVAEGKDLTDVKFIRFIFDFETNTGSEQKIYIDNVRLLNGAESIEDDWIHMAIDSNDSTASYALNEDAAYLKADGSILSMQIISGESNGTWTLSPQAQYGAGIDMTSGILGGYFYFGDTEPSVKIRLTDKDWNGGVTLSLTMADAGDGWYYGYIDVSTLYFYADQIEAGASAAEIIRAKLYFPANSTVYVDGLMFPTEVPEEYLPTEPETSEPTEPEPTTTEPETEPAVVGDDFLANAEIACGELQTEVTNGSDIAWKLVPELGTEHNWVYPSVILDGAYNISNHKLIMEVKPVNMTSFQINLSTVDGNWLSGVTSKTLTVDAWNTVEFDLSASGYSEMSKFGLGMEIDGGDNYAVYIDNVYLLPIETVEDDLINLSFDLGESTAGTYEKVYSFVKDENSGLSLKLTPTADAAAKASLNVDGTFGANYDMSTGVLGAWFYFGDQTPSASVNFAGNWKASVSQSWSFGTGVNGWYYGKVDLSTTTFYEEAGTMTDVERLRIVIPAGYEPVYVDYLTYDADGGNIADETDMLYGAQFAYNSAHWTEETGLSYGKEYYEVCGDTSYQSWAFKATAAGATSAIAQMQLTQSYDATGKVLLFDVKANVATDIKVRFHESGWGDITTDKTVGIKAGDWATYKYDPTDLVVEGKDLTDVKFITFTFNFAANTGVERELYIDNVRLVAPETVDQDWINLGQDTGSWYCNSNTSLTDEKVKADGSTFSIKVTTPAEETGKFTFNTESITPDMSNGTLGAWFYFGDAEPKASVTFTAGNWKASIPVNFTFGAGEDGWYYGSVDTSAIEFYEAENADGVASDLTAVRRVQINLPADSTVFIDGLTYKASQADVESWNLVLEDDLKVNFRLSVDADVADAAQIKITVGGSEYIYNVSELTPDDEGLYEVSAWVAAAQMTDDILVQVVNGEEVLESETYTVRQYADTLLADETYSQYHALVKEMLNYGGYAQTYFGYNADDLANAGIEGVGASEIPEAADAEMSNTGAIDGISFYGASLVYRDKVAVRFYFSADSIDGLTFAANGAACDAVLKNGYYMVEVADINPEDLDDQITVTVTNGTDTVTVAYGPMNYIVRMNAKGSDSLKALLKAMYNYHLAAETLRPDEA